MTNGVTIPEGGPTDDFVDESVGWRVKAEHKPFGNGRIGEWDCVGQTWIFEVSPQDLGRQMRRIFQDPEEAKRRGQAATEQTQSGWTWEQAGAQMLARMQALRERPQKHTKATTIPVLSAGKQTGGKPAQSEIVAGMSVVDRRGSKALPPESRKATPEVRKAPTISLCMIVRNEERVLDACLTSVKPFVDEIVLVDTGSTDRTLEIAEAHGVKLHHFPWINDFSAARNVSLEQATGDWLFWMDADDTLPEACGRRLHELVLLAEEKVTGFLMQVHIPPNEGEHGFTIVDHVKLFRNKPCHRFEGRIHEQILEAIYRGGGTIERSDLYVVHSGYDYSPEGQQKKRERDLTILELDLAERPNHPFVWFNIGMTAHHLQDWPKAIQALERSLSLSKPHESTVRKVYAMLASSYLSQGDRAKARERLEAGLALFSNDPELLFRAGILFRELGDLPAAERHYLHLLSHREAGHIDSLDISMAGFKAHHNLAMVYQDLGRLDQAEAHWRAGLSLEPDFVPSLLGLAETGLRQGKRETVQEVVARLEAVAPGEAERLRLRLAAIPPSPP